VGGFAAESMLVAEQLSYRMRCENMQTLNQKGSPGVRNNHKAKTSSSTTEHFMKPTREYKEKQERLCALIEKSDKTTSEHSERTRLEYELRAMFAEAFGLKRVTPQKAEEIRTQIGFCLLKGFDHCTYWSSQDAKSVVVTQPYMSNLKPLLERQFERGDALKAQVTEAQEWGFYYPTKANLALVYINPAQLEKTGSRKKA
jgi:hypothetical protein